jgi:dihydroorotate dehydrogenase (NAD+) catalytic subunit
MLRAEPSAALLGRPVSLYRSESREDGGILEFLILRKGEGTRELCSLSPGCRVSLLGPLGNGFPAPAETKKILFIGGGIGIAPVAGFASTLAPRSYDFCACFKSGCYGLGNIEPAELTLVTEDGTGADRRASSLTGILSDALTADTLAQKRYAAVYACGPAPMLAYTQAICRAAGTPCFVSMESRMACGAGACLGCAVRTVHGNKRCCADGPVFDAAEIIFEEGGSLPPAPRQALPVAATPPSPGGKQALLSAPKPPQENPCLAVNIAGLVFKNPVIAASGTFGYGKEYAGIFNPDALGGICTKGLTLEPRAGNGGVRLCETPAGLINSIGLENPGVRHFIAHELPELRALVSDTQCIANLSGSSIEDYVEGARLLDSSSVDAIELNISCPNVKAGGMAFGLHPGDAARATSAVRAATKKPLIVKLSPNAPDIVPVALAVIEAGADALSMVNTFQALAIDIESARPLFANVKAGLSGPAIKPLALRMVYDTVLAIKKLPREKQIPVIALGGIASWRDAVEFIMAGAIAVQAGTATFANPRAMLEIIGGLREFMMRKGCASIEQMCGAAL